MNPSPRIIRLTEAADRDVAQILRATRNTFGPLQADAYRATILSALTHLATGPDAPGSTKRDDIQPGLRSLHVARQGRRGRHFILYFANPQHVIEIVRVLYDAMDLARHIPPQSG